MNRSKLLLLQFLTVLLTLSINAQMVSTNSALTSAISAATSGTTIILANGTWTNVQISINKTGTAANPITIKAETAGSVFFEGNSYVKMGGAYIRFEGVIFRNPSGLNTGIPVVEFKASSTNCNNCKLTNVTIDSYNVVGQETSVFKWVLVNGQYNEISNCSFIGKYGVGSIINDNRDAPSSGAANTEADYTKIHHNYFANRTFVGSFVDDYNDQDAIRIGNSATSLYDSFTEVYDNFFNNWQGEIEVISNKSCNNKYYNNTFRNYSGSLTLRHGNNCEVYGNYFFAENRNFSGGIRVIGENHKIYNNYIEGVNSTKLSATGSSTSSNLGGINVMKGQSNSLLNGYYQVKNATIVNNTFVNCDFGIRVGGGSQTLPALDLVIANNIFLMNSTTKKAVDQIIAADASSPYTYTGNIRQSGTWTLNGNVTDNTISTSGLLTIGTDFYRLVAGSTAINAGKGTYSFLTNDILDGNRPVVFSAGAEEFEAGGTKLPYKVADVGVKVGFVPDPILSVTKYKIASQNLLIYPIPVQGEYLNISFKDKAIGNVQVIDLQGKTLLEAFIDATEGRLEISRLPKGVYSLKVHGISKLFVK